LDFETSAPFKSTSPAYVAPRFSDSFLNNRPLRAFKNVVFPEPLGPSTHSKRPHRAEPLVWSKIVFVVVVVSKSFLLFFIALLFDDDDDDDDASVRFSSSTVTDDDDDDDDDALLFVVTVTRKSHHSSAFR
jgi:hypothetical protein